LFAANSGDATISVYSLDEISGRLRPQGYSFVSGAQQLGAIAIAPGANRIYVPDAASGSTSVYGFAVDPSTGRLQAISTSPFLTTGAGPSCIAINPAGTFAYVTNAATSGPGVVSAFVIGTHDGALAPQPVPSYAAGSHPACAVIDPSGNFLYVTNSGSGSVSEYRIASGGSLTSLGTISTGSRPQALTFDPSGKFLLVANSAGASVSVFAMNSVSGALTAVPGSPFATGATPVSIAFDPAGTYVYVANQGATSISAFAFNSSTGALTALAGSPVALSGAPGAIATDAAGLYLFASIPAANELVQFAIDADGGLTFINDQRSRTAPNSVALASGNAVKYAPAYAEIANQASGGGISSYSIDPMSGALSPVDGFAIGAQGAFGVAADQFGRFIFATNDDSSPGNVSSFILNSGFLNSGGSPVTAGKAPQELVGEPSGTFLYVLNLADGSISAYSVNGTSGALTSLPASPFASAPGPNAVAVDPSGRFLYVCSFTGAASDGIAAYRIAPASGSLSAVTGSPFLLARPIGPAVHPSGKFLYALSGNGINTLQAYAMDTATGSLTILGPAIAVGSQPVATALDPDGRFLYVANNNDSTVSAFKVAWNGTVAAVAGSPFATATAPLALAVDESGSFLYVATSSGEVSIFAIDQKTGVLGNRSDMQIPANAIGIALTGTMN
jgi:6-phosphogluconolactonase (cycloisomerase 2 family)